MRDIREMRSKPGIIIEVEELLPTLRLRAYYRNVLALGYAEEPNYRELTDCLVQASNL